MKRLTLTHLLKSINITLGREGEENMELEVKLVGQNNGEVKTGDSRRQVESRWRENCVNCQVGKCQICDEPKMID